MWADAFCRSFCYCVDALYPGSLDIGGIFARRANSQLGQIQKVGDGCSGVTAALSSRFYPFEQSCRRRTNSIKVYDRSYLSQERLCFPTFRTPPILQVSHMYTPHTAQHPCHPPFHPLQLRPAALLLLLGLILQDPSQDLARRTLGYLVHEAHPTP